MLKLVGAKNLRNWQVVASSPVVDVQPYLGQVAQFSLTTSIPVVRGETIALTTPTWAPVLSIDLNTDHFAYRQSRSRNCNSPPATTQAQVTVGQNTRYVCDYPGTRVEYSATEVTDPVPTPAPTTTTRRRPRKSRAVGLVRGVALARTWPVGLAPARGAFAPWAGGANRSRGRAGATPAIASPTFSPLAAVRRASGSKVAL